MNTIPNTCAKDFKSDGGVVPSDYITEPKYRWMQFRTVKSYDIPPFDTTNLNSDVYPASFVSLEEPTRDWAWLHDKDRDGGLICMTPHDDVGCPSVSGGYCSTPASYCNSFITSINAAGQQGTGGPGSKPWYSNPAAANAPGNTETDSRGGCGSWSRATSAGSLPGGGCCVCHYDSVTCNAMHFYCGGLTMGEVDLYGIGKLSDQGPGQDTNVAGILIAENSNSCQSGFCAGAKYVSVINDDCFKPSNYGAYATERSIYGIPNSVTITGIDNNPSALDPSESYAHKDPSDYVLAVAETTSDLYNAGNGQGTFVAGVGNLLYFPPIYDSNFTPWFTSFTSTDTFIQTNGAIQDSPKLPRFVTYIMPILAYTSIIPRYMMFQAFDLYGSHADRESMMQATFQNTIFPILEPNTLSDAIDTVKKWGDGLASTFDTQGRRHIYESLEPLITGLFYGSGSNMFIKPVQISGQADKGIPIGLQITVPTDIADNWGVTNSGINAQAIRALQKFFGEDPNKAPYTTFEFYGTPQYHTLAYTLNEDSETVGITSSTTRPPTSYYQVFAPDAKTIDFKFNLATTFTLALQSPSLMMLGYIMTYGGGVAQTSICDSGTTTLQNLQAIPAACIQDMAIAQPQLLSQTIDAYCNEKENDASLYPRSTGLDQVMVSANNPVCVCYNSYIGPPQDRGSTDSRISLCFARACAEGLGKVDVRKIEQLSDADCKTECATLKGWFGDSLYSVNPDELDIGRVKSLCNFTPMSQVKELYNTNAVPLVLTLGVTMCIVAYTLLVIFKRNKKIGAIVLASFLVLFVGLGGILLARKDTLCEHRSTDPEKRKQDCLTRIGIKLPEVMCKPALDHCECGWTEAGQMGCPMGCECKGTGCNPLVSTPVAYYRQKSKRLIIFYVCALVVSFGFLMVLNIKYTKRNIPTIAMSVLALGGILTGLIFAAVGRRRPKTIFGCSPQSSPPPK